MNVECGAGARESPTTEARATAAAVVCVAKTSEPATTTSATAAIMTAANALSEEKAADVGDKETRRLFSVGDVSHANGTISVESFNVATTTTTTTMTVSSGVKNNEDSEMVSVETLDKSETVVDVSIKNESKNGWKEFRHSEMEMEDRDDEDDEDEGGRLSEENEAMNLCSKDILPMSPAQQQQQQPLLSAKMRLKKQRLEAEAAALSSRLSSPWSSHESPSPPTTTTADALHQLAEAAERKQVSHKSIKQV